MGKKRCCSSLAIALRCNIRRNNRMGRRRGNLEGVIGWVFSKLKNCDPSFPVVVR